jgi:hypothetical protein
VVLCNVCQAQPFEPPHHGDGSPDLEGYYTNASLTRLERPVKYGDRAMLTEREVSEIEQANRELIALGNKPTAPSTTVKDLPADCSDNRGRDCNYNAAWTDPGTTVMRVGGEPRTSFLTNPLNGKLPGYTDEAVARGLAAHRYGTPLPPGVRINDNPETRSLGERCLTSFGYSAGPVMLPLLYNNLYRIVQSRDSVAIEVEMVHDVRLVRLNAAHRSDGLRPWFGDSVGHYEGDTLVVETTHFPQAQSFMGAWENLKVTERFTRVARDRLRYRFKVEDPSVWQQSFSGEYEFVATGARLFEYACHEGNYALAGILAGARAEEAAIAAKNTDVSNLHKSLP